eukprot:SAG22_NODE_9278_length_599_cov_0.826000_1_plen_180_part_10
MHLWFYAGAFLYPVCIPVVLWMVLRHEKTRLTEKHGNTEEFNKRYEFMVSDYKPEYYYWDCVEMIRKVVLAGILSILGPVQSALATDSSATGIWAAPGSQFQLLVGIFVSTVFMVLVGACKPYQVYETEADGSIKTDEDEKPVEKQDTNKFKVMCDFCGTMMLVLAVLLKGSDTEEGLDS